MKKILLISPSSDNESLWITGEESPDAKIMNNMVPVGLATVAALTPPEIKVDIWDELVHGVITAECFRNHMVNGERPEDLSVLQPVCFAVLALAAVPDVDVNPVLIPASRYQRVLRGSHSIRVRLSTHSTAWPTDQLTMAGIRRRGPPAYRLATVPVAPSSFLVPR